MDSSIFRKRCGRESYPGGKVDGLGSDTEGSVEWADTGVRPSSAVGEWVGGGGCGRLDTRDERDGSSCSNCVRK